MRTARIARLRDEGLQALRERSGASDLALARTRLAELLRIAEPGDPAAAELRHRIELASHYGLFHPGQAFTDAIGYGARGPEMIVVPHGAFRMGAPDEEEGASDSERPVHYVRFDRGFAMSRTEVTVDQFARFVASAGYRTTAERRGYSMVYEARSGNFVRRNGVDWRHGHDGREARGDMPVLHVSARDADAYAEWLGERSGYRYRLPSEAEFEYALRAGSQSRFPWGEGVPPPDSGNFTGARDRGPGGRRWNNAFAGYGDGWWGPAPVATFDPSAFGLHDLAGNVSEWVADCWHDGYRRAPADGNAWLNPGCRERVMRGGAWASAPEQTRSAWRAAADADTTNARLGFRVVRDL
jgi:formylglycine-generating enzyme required for sulfatase activity